VLFNTIEEEKKTFFRSLSFFFSEINVLLTSRASITVPTPTVNADVGTFVISLSKKRAFAMIVSCANVFTRVRDTKLEPKYYKNKNKNKKFLLKNKILDLVH
jgi:hypothetical protein